MFIISVTPLDKGIFKDELTYFSKINLEPGALVMVPIRGRKILSLVISVKPASVIKADLKKADFSLKKIITIVHSGIFNPDFLKAAKEASLYFGVNLGMTLKFTMPKVIIDSLTNKKWPPIKIQYENKPSEPASTSPDCLALQESPAERIGFYRSLIREALARDQSVFVLVPTAADANKLFPYLGKGIENHTKVLHNKISDQTVITEWQSALENDRPTLYIATALFLSMPKKNLGLIIVENEGSSDYEPASRPYIDGRRLAEFIARAGHLKLIFGSTTLRPETIYRTEKREIIPAAPLKYRLTPNVERLVVDMCHPTSEGEKNIFRVLGQEIETILREAETKKKKIFLLVGRLGLAPTTVCNDCDAILTCAKCQRPLVLFHPKNKNRLYTCRHCHTDEIPTDHCPNCGSWRLTTLGIGTDTVAKAVASVNKKITTFVLDSEHAKTNNQANKIIADFTTTKDSAVLIGTDMAWHYLLEPVDYIGLVSLDYTFALPGFRVKEKIIFTIANLAELALKKIIIQTRLIEENVWRYIESGNLLDYYRDEIKEREGAGWPPFSVLIKITRTGPEQAVTKDMKKLARLLEPFQPLIYPTFTPPRTGQLALNLLIKIAPTAWPNQELSAVLTSLPPVFIVNVEPADIL
ncbi:MAG: hypothetical protein A2571_03720 [Candidatus Vogelbacteria bacterium RIFOXYD1_FULL_44_32]|uniref:Primosomal protein N' 3' DNA-binding domain-containing protein n=1 Tax=Candidatus Vogelbacteria bacterium RIFOXYD1_FULL_44_32 TaxID=1802438 RepID=A0A1G2QDF3_9BACT|nr:MAG: hypothetical protein A2571_03720 [Candidatus Vogelbacteria bacterium RIFOXYD1_FULL_44_32]